MDDFIEKHTQLVNDTDLDFIDISFEKERVYRFPNGARLEIKNPLYLHVSKSGEHRIFTDSGTSYYIKPSESWWIEWTAKKVKPNFVK